MLAEAVAPGRAPVRAGTMRALLHGSLDEVRRVNDSVARFLWERQVPADRVHDVQLVLEELVTNILRHGGGGRGDGVRPGLVVEAEVGDDLVRLVVEDDGPPFDPTALPETPLPPDLEERRAGGLGLRIVRRLVSRFSYTRLAHGNRVEAILPVDAASEIAD